MPRSAVVGLVAVALAVNPARAHQTPLPGPEVQRYLAWTDSVVALTHVRILDGTGRPALTDQTVVIVGDKIARVGPTVEVRPPAGGRVLNLAGYTVIPGLIGLHDHMYYSSAAAGSMKPMLQSYPRLFLGAGVTTVRTTGSVDSYQELNLKDRIDRGLVPGPEIVVTGPYLQGAAGPGPGAMHPLSGPADAARLVRYWAEEGVTWFKAYTQISRAELRAAIEEAHRRAVRVTAHLCSVGFREAVALGIDNLEHGYLDNLEYFPGKVPDQCPSDFARARQVYAGLDLGSAPVRATIKEMVARGVSMTSTLAVIELGTPNRVPRDPRVLEALFPPVAAAVDSFYAAGATRVDSVGLAAFRKAMDFERAFVAAGGLLGAGSDPCCLSVIAGYGDQRNYELLVEAGFPPEQAIAIMTANGARILRRADRVGTIEPGKQADLVVLRGDPAARPADIRNVVTVLRRGQAYDAVKLVASVKGQIGLK